MLAQIKNYQGKNQNFVKEWRKIPQEHDIQTLKSTIAWHKTQIGKKT